jgi:SAM-dependent MidA family methyltransferase
VAESPDTSSERQPATGHRQSGPIRGIIFSNELLDALPVHRLGWDAKERCWFEWGVGFAGGHFVWTRMSERIGSPRFAIDVPPALLKVLPDGFTTEIGSAAAAWWREAAGWLRRGRLLTLDYGLSAEEFFAPHRAQGTLRAYHRHRLSDNVLANVGEQDITAHVNFTAIQSAGEAAGLKTTEFMSQAQFLTGIARRAWNVADGWGQWTPEQTRQFQTLVHPEHLGRPFRVLVQSR